MVSNGDDDGFHVALKSGSRVGIWVGVVNSAVVEVDELDWVDLERF